VTLLGEIMEAHGGLDRWRRARRIRARVRTGGLLPRTRFPGNKLARFQATIDVGQPRVIVFPFPTDDRRAVFDRGAVRIESEVGEPIAARRGARQQFHGLAGLRRNLRWDALDTVYFGGYALWNYLTTPLLLARDGVEVREGEQWKHGRETWRRLEVMFPPSIPTHCPHQTFYADSAGRLMRLDYTAEVIGRFARAAHELDAHREFDGLLFPTRRRVHPRGPRNRALPRPILVALEIESVRVEFN
jgi:hypothetical protein